MTNIINKNCIEIGKIALKSTLCLTVILGSVHNIHCGKNNTQANIESSPKSSNTTKTIKKAKSQFKKDPIATKMFRLLQETKKNGKCIIEDNTNLYIDKIKKLIYNIQHAKEHKGDLNRYLKGCFEKDPNVVNVLNYALISKQKELVEKNIEESNKIIEIAKDKLSQQGKTRLQLDYDERILKLSSALEEYHKNGFIGEDQKLDKNHLNLYEKILKEPNNKDYKNIFRLQRSYIQTLYNKIQTIGNEDILRTNPPFYNDTISLDRFALINGSSDKRENLKEVGKLLEAYLLDIIINNKIKHHQSYYKQNCPKAVQKYFSGTEILEYATDFNRWFDYDNKQKQFKVSEHAPNVDKAKKMLNEHIIKDIIDMPILLEDKLKFTKIIKEFDKLFQSDAIKNYLKSYFLNNYEKDEAFIHHKSKASNIIPQNKILDNEELRPYVLILNHMIDNDNEVKKYFEEYSSNPKGELDAVMNKMLRFFIDPKHNEAYSQYLAINVIKFLLDLKVIKEKGQRQIFIPNAIAARKQLRFKHFIKIIARISKHNYNLKTNKHHNGYYIACLHNKPSKIEPFYLKNDSLTKLTNSINNDQYKDTKNDTIFHTIMDKTTFEEGSKITVTYILGKQSAPEDDDTVIEENDEDDSVSLITN